MKTPSQPSTKSISFTHRHGNLATQHTAPGNSEPRHSDGGSTSYHGGGSIVNQVDESAARIRDVRQQENEGAYLLLRNSMIHEREEINRRNVQAGWPWNYDEEEEEDNGSSLLVQYIHKEWEAKNSKLSSIPIRKHRGISEHSSSTVPPKKQAIQTQRAKEKKLNVPHDAYGSLTMAHLPSFAPIAPGWMNFVLLRVLLIITSI